jgi:hypothetical protein
VVVGIVLCGGFALGVTLISVSVGVDVAWPLAFLVFLPAAYALHVARIATPVQHINTAVNALSAGRIEDAEAHLAHAERSRAAVARISTNMLRAQICMYRAKLSEARAFLDATLSIPLPWLGRFHARLNLASARAHRALVHALTGDEAAARADVEAIARVSLKRTDALAYAALAEAVLLHRAGDAAALRQHLDRNRALLFESTAPRLRALVRALRWSTQRNASAYRMAAVREPGAAPHALEAWIDTVLPGASELAQEPAAPTVVLGDTGASEAPRPQRAPAPPALHVAMPAKRKRLSGQVLVLWLLLIVAFLAIWQFLTPSAVRPSETAPQPPRSLSSIFFIPVLGGAVIFALMLGRGRRVQQDLLRASWLMATSPADAQVGFVRLTRSGFKQVAAQAHLMLAMLAERAADFAAALAHVDAALVLLREPGMRAASYDLQLPEMRAMRALALAALDRRQEAADELARVEREFPAFYMLERARVRIEQLLAVRASDFASVARTATERPADLPISYRDDVLGEIATLVTSGAPIGRLRLSRLQYELESDPLLAHWLDVTAPDLMARFSRLQAA